MTRSGSTPPATASRPRRGWVGPLVVFGLSCVVFAASARIVTLPPAWRTFEFCQYAEIGRNLARDGVYDTQIIEPMALAFVDREQVGPTRPGHWPVVNRYPLPCLAVAGLMTLFGPTDLAAAWSNGLAAGLLAATLYAAARLWLGSRWAAVVALLWLTNPAFYGEFILLGTPDVWFAGLFLAELVIWAQLDPATLCVDPTRVRWRWALGVGILGGLAYLARFNASIFLAIQLVILGGVWRRWREALIVAAAVLTVATPSLWDTYRHFGRPTVSIYSAWNLLDDIGAYQVEPWLYYQIPSFGRLLIDHASGLGLKILANLQVLAGFRGVWSLWRLDVLLPLAGLGAWVGGLPGSAVRQTGRLMVGLFGLQLFLFSGLRLEVGDPGSAHNGRYFFWFAPCAVLLGAATLQRLGGARRWWGWLIVGGAIGWQLVVAGWGWQGVIQRHQAQTTNIGQDPIRVMLAQVVRPGQVIASNQPHITAWFSGLQSISLPANPDELDRLDRESPTPADYVFIDLNYNTIELDKRWTRFVVGNAREPTPWEVRLLRDHRYVLPPQRTRPLGYVIMRRSKIPPSAVEIEYSR